MRTCAEKGKSGFRSGKSGARSPDGGGTAVSRRSKTDPERQGSACYVRDAELFTDHAGEGLL
jgi:hypothetical protein